MALPSEFVDGLKRWYPALGWLTALPGLESFFQTVYGENLTDPLEIQNRFYASDWFQNNALPAREWEALKATDPATAAKQSELQSGAIDRLATSAGITLDPDELAEITEQSLKWNLQQPDIVAMLGTFAGTDVRETGTIATTAASLQRDATSYFLALTENQAVDYATQIFSGSLTYDGVVNQFRTDANNFYPHMADSLDRGVSLQQATVGVQNQVAKVLGVSPETIDLTDDRFSHLIDYADPNSGERRMKTLAEINQWARSQPEYRSSDAGRQAANEYALYTMRILGMVA